MLFKMTAQLNFYYTEVFAYYVYGLVYVRRSLLEQQIELVLISFRLFTVKSPLKYCRKGFGSRISILERSVWKRKCQAITPKHIRNLRIENGYFVTFSFEKHYLPFFF